MTTPNSDSDKTDNTHVSVDADQGQVPYPPDFGVEDIDPPSLSEHGVIRPRAKAVRAAALARQHPKNRVKSLGRKGQSTNRILAQQKRRQALEMRKAGATYDDIATAVGYNDRSAARKSVMKAFNDVIQEPVAELRTMQIERLNHMLLVLWPKVQGGDERAIQTALGVMNKIDALMGTEAATHTDININQKNAVLVIDGNKDDYIRAMKQMAGLGVQPDGTNGTPVQQDDQPAAGMLPPGMSHVTIKDEDVVDAEVVEDGGTLIAHDRNPVEGKDTSLADALGPEGIEAVKNAMAPPRTSASKSKQFNFGVDPTVKRGPVDKVIRDTMEGREP